MLFRNTAVYTYRSSLNRKASLICKNFLGSVNDAELGTDKINSEFEELLKIWDLILNTHSYEEMLFKFWKPLKNKYWLTEEQINFLNHEID